MQRPYINAIVALSMTCSMTYADASWDPETSSYKTLVVATPPLSNAPEKDIDPNFAKATSQTTPTISAVEYLADLAKTGVNVAWTAAASFEAESLKYHLENMGLGNSYARNIATTLIQTPMVDGNLSDWATQVGLKLALNFGILPNDLDVKNFTLSSVAQYITHADNLASLAVAGVAFYNPIAANLLNEEISAIAAATPGYVSWLVAEDESADNGQTAPTISSSLTEDEQAKTTTSFLSKAAHRTQKVWNKFTRSVKVGAQRAYDALTWENTKTFVATKTKKFFGFSSKK